MKRNDFKHFACQNDNKITKHFFGLHYIRRKKLNSVVDTKKRPSVMPSHCFASIFMTKSEALHCIVPVHENLFVDSLVIIKKNVRPLH